MSSDSFFKSCLKFLSACVDADAENRKTADDVYDPLDEKYHGHDPSHLGWQERMEHEGKANAERK